MGNRPDNRPDVHRVADYWTHGKTAAQAINAATQACRDKETGRCGGVVSFQPHVEYLIAEPIILDVPNVTYRMPSSPFGRDQGCLKLAYNGPMFDVPHGISLHDGSGSFGGIRFEGMRLWGNGCGPGIRISTGQEFRQWFSLDWCKLTCFRRAIEVCREDDGAAAIGAFHIRQTQINWNEQGIVFSNGARCNIMSVRDSWLRQNNRACKYEFANYFSGRAHTWDNVDVEGSGNAILYENSSPLKFENLWMEENKGDFVLRLVDCEDIHIGYDKRSRCEMASPVQLHRCGRGQVWCDALATEPCNV